VHFAPASGFRGPLPAAQRRRACLLPLQAVSARGWLVDDTTSSGVSAAPDMPHPLTSRYGKSMPAAPPLEGSPGFHSLREPWSWCGELAEAALAYLAMRLIPNASLSCNR
jgi:hypothetical protein